MIIKLQPHPDQIRWYAKAALSGFGTLDNEEAMQFAKDSIEGLLNYLEAFEVTDRATFEHGASDIKIARSLEVITSDREA